MALKMALCHSSSTTVSKSFLDAVKSLLTTDTGVDLSPIISDLCDDTKDSVERSKMFCTMGLMLKGAKFEVAPTTYYIMNNTHIRVNVLKSASFLKDDVTYEEYDFRYQSDDKHWSLFRHYEQHTSIDSWESYPVALIEGAMPDDCTLAIFMNEVDQLITESKKEGKQ